MKNIVIQVLAALLLASTLAVAMDMVEDPVACKQCGMDRAMFAHSRMLVTYADGTAAGLCSLHCAAREVQQNRGKQVGSFMVADYATRKLVDAGRATWVVGGRRSGVMTSIAKWAFAREKDARAFVEEQGGVVNSFEQAMNLAVMEVLDQEAEERAVEKELR